MQILYFFGPMPVGRISCPRAWVNRAFLPTLYKMHILSIIVEFWTQGKLIVDSEQIQFLITHWWDQMRKFL